MFETMPQRHVGRRIDQIVPALVDGGAAVGAVAVEVDAGPFELDDGQRRARLPLLETAEHGVGSLAGDAVVLFQVPGGRVLDGPRSRGLAEDFVEEIALKLGLGELGESAARFEVGPADQDGVGGVDRRLVESPVDAGVLEKPREDQPIGFRLSGREGRAFLEQGELHGKCFTTGRGGIPLAQALGSGTVCSKTV